MQPCVIQFTIRLNVAPSAPHTYRTHQDPHRNNSPSKIKLPIGFKISPAISARCNLTNIYYMSKQYAEMERLLRFLQMCLVCCERALVSVRYDAL